MQRTNLAVETRTSLAALGGQRLPRGGGKANPRRYRIDVPAAGAYEMAMWTMLDASEH